MRPGDAPLVARALIGDDAAPAQLAAHPEGSSVADAALTAARQALAAHADGDGVVIVVGRPSYAESGEVVAEAARVLAKALPKATFLPALRRGNVFGALDMGLAPGILPGRVGLDDGPGLVHRAPGARCPAATGRDTAGILASMASESAVGEVTALILLGADPLSDFPDRVGGQGRAVGRALHRGRDRAPLRVGGRLRRRGAALRRGPRAPGYDDQH